MLYRDSEVLACECEMCFIHSLLSKIPNDLPLEQLVTRAGDLFIQYPPQQLADEARCYRYSNEELDAKRWQHKWGSLLSATKV